MLNTVYYLSQPVENVPYDYYLEFLSPEEREQELQYFKPEQIEAGDGAHALRRAARRRSFTSTRRMRSRPPERNRDTARPPASATRSNAMISAPSKVNKSTAVRFLVISPGTDESPTDTVSGRQELCRKNRATSKARRRDAGRRDETLRLCAPASSLSLSRMKVDDAVDRALADAAERGDLV